MGKLLAITLALILIAQAGAIYIKHGVVVEVNEVITFEDSQRELWSFYGEDWEIGNTIFAIMDNNKTECIYDDIIVCVF